MVGHDGHLMVLRDPVEVPVLVGASGPRNLALAGSVADGALLPGVDWEHDVALVRRAATDSGRDPDRLRFVMTRTCIITDDPARDAQTLKPFCVRLAQVGAGPMFAAAGFRSMLLHTTSTRPTGTLATRRISPKPYG